MESLKRIAARIQSECDPMIKYSRATGRFLYRGAGTAGITVEVSEPDLLVPGTYPPEGTAFFRRLEAQLARRASPAKPSTGHIAVANQTEAGLWGAAHSCWPTGPFHYAWLPAARLLYGLGPPPRGPGLSAVRVDEGLEEALLRGH